MHVENQQERLLRPYAGVSAAGELDSQLDLGFKSLNAEPVWSQSPSDACVLFHISLLVVTSTQANRTALFKVPSVILLSAGCLSPTPSLQDVLGSQAG